MSIIKAFNIMCNIFIAKINWLFDLIVGHLWNKSFSSISFPPWCSNARQVATHWRQLYHEEAESKRRKGGRYEQGCTNHTR